MATKKKKKNKELEEQRREAKRAAWLDMKPISRAAGFKGRLRNVGELYGQPPGAHPVSLKPLAEEEGKLIKLSSKKKKRKMRSKFESKPKAKPPKKKPSKKRAAPKRKPAKKKKR
jgi:hypothetical protein